MKDLSSNARALLKAARADGPSTAARAKIWGDVAQATGVGGAVGAATVGALTSAGPATTVAVTASASKLLALGVLLGSAMTVGIAVTLLRVVPVAAPSVNAGAPAPLVARPSPPPAVLDPASTNGTGDRAGTPSSLASPIKLDPATVDHKATSAAVAPASPIREVGEDALMREATLLAEARGALVRGDAQGALTKLRATERLPRRALVPEELSLKAHALRVLGKSDEADETDVTLRLRYPEHALSR